MRVSPALVAMAVAGIAVVVLSATLPTTREDYRLPGSQPLQSGTIETPTTCVACHGGYDNAVEPAFNWRGSMMAHAARDPFFYAALAIANQDAAESGDLCIRCHSPKAWLEGRSVPTDASALTSGDRHGVQCSVCHGLVKPTPLGVNPYPNDSLYTANTYALDQAYLATLGGAIPPASANGMYVVDASDTRRGPFSNPVSPHATAYSPFHRDAAMCGTCHDVSNPAFAKSPDGRYLLTANATAPPSADPYTHFPVERTFSEWKMSEYNTPQGVYAPQFGGNKVQVSTCQDCHMRDVTGKGCNTPGAPIRTDMPLHDLTGGNTVAPRLVAALYPAEVDTAAISAGILRARYMLQNAATLDLSLSPLWSGWHARVRVTNETGHKLPSGYVEGRRMWLHIRAFDAEDAVVYESGRYDAGTATLVSDPDIVVYECDLGISPSLAPTVGLPAGPSFHFVLNDSIYKDNRIPPRGFTNAGFAAIQASPVGAEYADGQYWDDSEYRLPAATRRVQVELLYQTASREYVEFLRDENTTNNAGQVLHDAWAAHGKSTPEVMRSVTADVPVVTDAGGRGATGAPQFTARTVWGEGRVQFTLELARAGLAKVEIFDARSRVVAVVFDGSLGAGAHAVDWNTRGHASGVYFARLTTGVTQATRKVIVVR